MRHQRSAWVKGARTCSPPTTRSKQGEHWIPSHSGETDQGAADLWSSRNDLSLWTKPAPELLSCKTGRWTAWKRAQKGSRRSRKSWFAAVAASKSACSHPFTTTANLGPPLFHQTLHCCTILSETNSTPLLLSHPILVSCFFATYCGFRTTIWNGRRTVIHRAVYTIHSFKNIDCWSKFTLKNLALIFVYPSHFRNHIFGKDGICMRVWFGIKQLHQCYTHVMLILCTCFKFSFWSKIMIIIWYSLAYVLSFACCGFWWRAGFAWWSLSTGHTNSGRASMRGVFLKEKTWELGLRRTITITITRKRAMRMRGSESSW